MFGMGKESKDTKGSKKDIFFDLEKEITKDPIKYKEIDTKVRENIQELKGALRSGADKENYDKYGMLLHGFASMQKVLARVNKKAR